jgi:chaperonin GroES
MALAEAYADPMTDGEGEAMPAEVPAIDPVQWLGTAPQFPNVLDAFDEAQRAELADLIEREYEIDRTSMGDWLKSMEMGLKLAQAVREDKSFPWPSASNIKYPLVISAALQFNARAYPAIIPPGDIVKCVTHGKDPGGVKKARAERVSAHMSYQLRHKMPEWEPDTDRLLLQLAVVGKMHRKVWVDPGLGRIRSRVCKPGTVVVNAAAQTIGTAPRISEDLSLYPHEVIERQRGGMFEPGDWYKEHEGEADQRDSQAPCEFIEQHRLYDFDGDGYPEPYVCTLHKASKRVVRIVANWKPEGVTIGQDGTVLAVKRAEYFVDYDFIPAVDGSYWSIGLGLLLQDISASINDTINRINDAATLASLGGGFMGKEARLAGGPVRFQPGEWKQVTAAGGDLRAAVVPLPTTPPSPVLFQMLQLLIEAAREVANVKDIAGEATRSNQPATTTLALIEQGMAVFTAIYKRIHRSLKAEFGMVANAAAEVTDPQEYALYHDAPVDVRADYAMADMDLEPVADPRAVTNPQKLAQAQLLGELAAGGQVDAGVATQRALEAAGIPDTEELAPKPDPMAQVMAEAQARGAMLANVEMALKAAKLEAEIAKIHADATKAMADAEAADPANPINVALAQVQMLKGMVDADRQRLEGMAGASGNGAGAGGTAQGGGSPQGAGAGSLLAFGGSGPAPVGQGEVVPGPM